MAVTTAQAPNPVPAPACGWRRLWTAAGAFLTGAGLPVFLTAAALVYEAFLVLVILAPPGWGVWSSFAEEFKVWCFSYDPRTGGMEWMAVIIMLAEPAFIVALLLTIWRFGHRSSSRVAGGWRRHFRAALAGLCIGFTAAGGLYAYGRPSSEVEEPLPFPGERIRTQIAPPDFTLVDHQGNPVSLAELRGRVTLVTGVYAMCSTTCPQILVQIKELVDSLQPEARARLGVLAMSLNPEYETTGLMAGIAEGYGLEYPGFRYLNGAPAVMHPLLRDFQFAPRRSPVTGFIEHANLFILIDARGRIAYRFNLDNRHRSWLRAAVLALVEEAVAARS